MLRSLLLLPERKAETSESENCENDSSSSGTLELAPQPKKRPRILKMLSTEVAKGPDPPADEGW